MMQSLTPFSLPLSLLPSIFLSPPIYLSLSLAAPLYLSVVIKTGETGFTIFRLLTKAGVWVQANARVVFRAGRPDFIVVRQKALT